MGKLDNFLKVHESLDIYAAKVPNYASGRNADPGYFSAIYQPRIYFTGIFTGRKECLILQEQYETPL
jgi:hypothetical protein